MNSIFPPLFGYTIHENPILVDQIHFPASKKKRIRAKWANSTKRPWNFRPSTKVYQIENRLVMHPFIAAKLRAELNPASQSKGAKDDV